MHELEAGRTWFSSNINWCNPKDMFSFQCYHLRCYWYHLPTNHWNEISPAITWKQGFSFLSLTTFSNYVIINHWKTHQARHYLRTTCCVFFEFFLLPFKHFLFLWLMKQIIMLRYILWVFMTCSFLT